MITYELGVELLENGTPIEHIEHEIETDLKTAKTIYDTWAITKEQAKYLKKIDENGNETMLLHENYATDIMELYDRAYDYNDMKIAIECETFYRLHKDEIVDAYDFEDFENIICLAVEIKNNWHIDNEFGNLSEIEQAYIQEYATRYLHEKYLEN